MKRVAFYVRVSTRAQSLLPQLHALRKFVEARPDWRVVRVYRDRKGGQSPSRASYNRLLADAAMNRFDAVVVWKLDRFGRSTPEILRRVRELDRYRVGFCATTQGGLLDTTGPHGRFVVGLLAIVAELEHDLNSERTRSAIAERRARGQAWGRPKRTPDPTPVLTMLAGGAGVSETARAFKVSRRTVDRIRDAHPELLTQLEQDLREKGVG